MKDSLISIIVPIYKVEKYLKTCLVSIVNQTYKNLEIILVDDGSPDNCPQICDKYAKIDNRIKVIHKENGGLSSARNAGLDVCKGEYISFVDSDDVLSKDFIITLYKTLVSCGADIAECDYLRFKDEEFEDTVIQQISDCSEEKIYKGEEMLFKLYEHDAVKHIVVWNKLYKRDIYDKIRFPVGKINEDEYTTYIAFDRSNKIAIIKNQLYYYRINSNSIMGKPFNEKRFDILDSFEERKKYYSNKGYEELTRKNCIRYQEILKSYYFNTKKYLNGNRVLIRNIKNRLRTNILDYVKSEREIKKIVREIFFSCVPNLYHLLANVKNIINIKQ